MSGILREDAWDLLGFWDMTYTAKEVTGTALFQPRLRQTGDELPLQDGVDDQDRDHDHN